MRQLSTFALGAVLLCALTACHRRLTTNAYDCSSPVNYTAVTKTLQPDGHCEVTFHVSDPKIDVDGHPEVGLDASKGDTLILEGSSGFRYTIGRNPGLGDDQDKCADSPLDFDAHKNEGLSHHDLGKFHWKAGGPKECHYRMNFLPSALNASIDPHIVVGSGGKTAGR